MYLKIKIPLLIMRILDEKVGCTLSKDRPGYQK